MGGAGSSRRAGSALIDHCLGPVSRTHQMVSSGSPSVMSTTLTVAPTSRDAHRSPPGMPRPAPVTRAVLSTEALILDGVSHRAERVRLWRERVLTDCRQSLPSWVRS